ncbi:hypothetical protein FOB63_002967 [Clavispora lusitaniae]|nr:Vesicle membrane receptor protein (v-SNARE) [Clavispora lusitaniae]KAF7582886.1 hypothetical protein FOB63_002967 [Clavispora lusitaniae]
MAFCVPLQMRTPLSRAQASPTATLKYKSITDSHLFGSISTMSSSVPYDPYIPNQTTGDQSNSRTAAIQAQIDDTVGIMRDNINKVAERGERLDSIENKTDNLAISAQGFRRGANRVRKDMWWKDMKMRLCIILGIIIVLIVIIVPIAVHFS